MHYDQATIYQLSLRVLTPEGTLAAATKMIPFLAGLGFRYIQLSPVVSADDGMDEAFWSERQKASGTGNPRNSYRIMDYFTVDPEYGDDADLDAFVRTAHRHGVGVILDLVYYHCGPNAEFLAGHPDFVRRNADGTPYTGEWHFPVLNFDNPALREYLWDNMVYFVRRFDIDGYRCDVGDLVPLDFWAEGIRRVRAVKAELFMLNEGREPSYLDVFDANYFYDGCFDKPEIAGGRLSASAFRARWEAHHRTLPPGGRMLRFIDNHDVASDSYADRHERLIGADGIDALLTLDYTLDGIPFLFNGYEVLDDLKHNMFANRDHGRDATVNWANALTDRGRARMQLVRDLNAMRLAHPALSGGTLTWLDHDAPDAVLAFLRDRGAERLLIAINLRGEPASLTIRDATPLPPLPAEPIIARGVAPQWRARDLHLDMLPYGAWVAGL